MTITITCQRWIYVLELRGKNFYIGTSTDLSTRINQHFIGQGAQWTRVHRPLKVIETFDDVCTESEALQFEDRVTLDYMKMYGWNKVRGGSFHLVNEYVVFHRLKQLKLINEEQLICTTSRFSP
jgi:predicted GIY-YIG superfamily endonuclease